MHTNRKTNNEPCLVEKEKFQDGAGKENYSSHVTGSYYKNMTTVVGKCRENVEYFSVGNFC